jgi:hypothetical protein
VDYTTGRTYHILPEGGATPLGHNTPAGTNPASALLPAAPYSEPVHPLRADGSADKEVLARLEVRHDDSDENVARRLALWDLQVRIRLPWLPHLGAE